MRRARTAVLLLAVLGLVGCGKKAKHTEPEPEPTGTPGPTAMVPPQTQPPQSRPQVPPAVQPQPVISAPAVPAPTPATFTPSGPPSTPTPPPTPPAPAPNPVTPAAVPPAFPPLVGPATNPPPLTTPAATAPPAAPPPALPAPPQPPQPPKGPPKEAVAKEGEPTKFKWPLEINGRDLNSYIKDLSDPDPSIRDVALQTIPHFGPTAQKAAGRAILKMMNPGGESDFGVRLTAYDTAGVLGFAEESEIKAAVQRLGEVADAPPGGGSHRAHALQALAGFGPKADPAIPRVIPVANADPAYTIRQAAAETLGAIGLNERTGPHRDALSCLCGKPLADQAVVVRLAAVRSLLLLGPPWAGARPAAVAGKEPPPPVIDVKGAAAYYAPLKKRLQPFTGKSSEPHPTGLVEPDRQVEIWIRVAVLRFDTQIDPKELDDTLNGITRYLTGSDLGPKLQALNALQVLGEIGARRIDNVVKVMLEDENLDVVSAAIATVVSMGPMAKPVLPQLEKLPAKYAALRDQRLKKVFAEAKRDPITLKKEEMEMVVAQIPEENVRILAERAIKMIKESGKMPAATENK